MNRKERRAQGHGQKKSARPAAPVSKAPPDPVALHEAGIQAYRAGDLGAAAALISRAIAFNGGMPSFHYNLGIVLKALGRLEEAAASYERAVALKPDHVDAHNNLGNVWKALGRREQARTSFEQALLYSPGNVDTHYNLGILCGDLGARDEAERHLRHCLASDPGDRRGAAILLAHLGAQRAPDRASQAQMLSIYDVRSQFWDQERSYFGATLVADGLRRQAASGALDILDIGCGTGLVGAQVCALAARLDGVDISLAMLEKAKAKGVYDGLFEADLAPFMAQREDSYDAVLGAATLIHFGDLEALFQAAARAARDKGLFVFTFFPLEAPDASAGYAVASDARLAQSGCFQHSASYVERLAGETGFGVLELKSAIHERNPDGDPVWGIVAVLRRQTR
jgi:predicted TPR repeat methyltransferase